MPPLEDISKDKDKSIIKRIKSSGEGYDHPNDGGTVTIGEIVQLKCVKTLKRVKTLKGVKTHRIRVILPVDAICQKWRKHPFVPIDRWVHLNIYPYVITLYSIGPVSYTHLTLPTTPYV